MAANQRRTSQRRAIEQAIEETDRPLTPAEVHTVARKVVPALGMATVYRALRALLEKGWLRPVKIPGEPQRYEVAGKDHHHHFHCRGCDRVFEVDGCPGQMRALTPKGFKLEGHELVLYGRCPACRKAK
ncbi:MAG: transcriptional repressor [Planctomycetota bacterium]